MARSMTGFGRVVTEYNGEHITMEISGVNHRFMECGLRIAPVWSPLENPLRELIRQQIVRGKVNVSIRREFGPTGRVRVRLDEDAAKAYINAGQRLAAMMETDESLSLDRLATLDGVFLQEDDAQELDAVYAVLSTALQEALRLYNQSRDTEGVALIKDMTIRLNLIAEAVVRIEARGPEMLTQYQEKLRERVRELLGDSTIKEERVAMEIALMADRMDITEEIVRLRAHLDRARELFASSEAIGRDLNFLVQEMQREINTMGSKLRDVEGGREVLFMKSELERLREQLQNIE